MKSGFDHRVQRGSVAAKQVIIEAAGTAGLLSAQFHEAWMNNHLTSRIDKDPLAGPFVHH